MQPGEPWSLGAADDAADEAAAAESAESATPPEATGEHDLVRALGLADTGESTKALAIIPGETSTAPPAGVAWAAGAVRILVDCRYTRLERHDGISRFTSRLVEELGRRHPVVMLVHDVRQLAMLPELPWTLGPSPTSPLEPIIGPLALNRLAPDIVYSPMQTIGPIGRRYALVTTVHDLIYYSHPKPPADLPWAVRALWRAYHLTPVFQRWVLALADAQVTISETTKALMLDRRMAPRPLRVIANGTDHPALTPRRRPPRGRDLLYAGSFMPYKNVEALAAAMHHLPGWRLRLLSRADEATVARLTALAPDGALDFMQGASDAEYQAALTSARALVTASREEGFGLPVVEAMALGTPVAVSDIPIFREVTGGHAELFDQESPEAIAQAVLRLADDSLWLKRSEHGESWSRRYDWGTAADELLAFLLHVVAARRDGRRPE